MRQADDNVDILSLQPINIFLRAFIQRFTGQEGQPLDEGGVGFGLGFGRCQTEEADLQSAFLHLGSDGRISDRIAVGIQHIRAENIAVGIQHIRAENAEFGLLQIVGQLLRAIVKLVVAEGDKIVANGVQHGDGVSALIEADIDGALAEVAGVHQIDDSTAVFIIGLQSCHLGIVLNGAVDVIGVQNDGLAGQILGHGIFCPRRGHQQCQGHDHGQEQC